MRTQLKSVIPVTRFHRDRSEAESRACPSVVEGDPASLFVTLLLLLKSIHQA